MILATFYELKLLAFTFSYGKVQDTKLVKIKGVILWKKEEKMGKLFQRLSRFC